MILNPEPTVRARSNPAGFSFPIVYFGNDWFGENRTSSHHIARHLGERFPLLYVESPGLRAPKATGRDIRKIFLKLAKSRQPATQIGPRMWHLTIPQVPFQRLPVVPALNRWWSVTRVRATLEAIGWQQPPVLWFTVPHVGGVVGQLGERFSVFYCVDDYAALPDVNAAEVRRMDEELSRRVDLVFAVSKKLEETKRTLNPNVRYAPHGVDVELFGGAATENGEAAEAVRGLQRPVIGYFGTLDARIDTSVLREIAERRPEWTLLLVGRLDVPPEELPHTPNVRYTGAVSYKDLPDYARAFDVCVMPYRAGAFARNANPLKLREYLATGKPVVSSPMEEAAQFSDLVRTAHTAEEFLHQIEEALRTDSPAQQQARRQTVAYMGWDTRCEEIVAELQTRMAGKRTL
jgi:glycosyltransferase involved in cell wall biosynthesis